jgi:predicted PurR-regulated permease PerM
VLIVFFTTIIIAAIISITYLAPPLSAPAQDTDQDSSQLSAQITQAQEDIRKELGEQGRIISNNIKEQFGFENAESNLTQAYQNAFTGDISSAVSQLQSTNTALDSSIVALLRSGQELISLSQNKSVALGNNTRIILKDFGQSISNLSIAANDIQSQLSQPK